MSSFSLVEKIKSLVSVIKEKNAVISKITEISNEVKSTLDKISKLEKLLKLEQRKYLDARKAVDACQLKAQSIREMENKRREQLEEESKGEVRRALSNEISKLEAERIDIENQLEHLWQEMYKVKENFDTVEKQGEERSKELSATIKELSNKEKLLSAEIPKLEKKIAEILKSMPEEWREKVVCIEKNSEQIPFAEVVNEICTSCFYPISNKDLGILNKGTDSVVECKNCFKLLYITTSTQPEDGEKTTNNG